MTKTIYYAATTLDGFIADPDDSLEWLFRQEQDAGGPLNYEAFYDTVGALVMGATTYEWILEHEGGGWPYTTPAWVMTHRELPSPRMRPTLRRWARRCRSQASDRLGKEPSWERS